MSIGRRGFFQMVGLGAVGSLASIPLFSVGSSGGLLADGPVDLLAGHLVVERAFVEGVAHTIDGGGYGTGVSFRSPSRTFPGDNDARWSRSSIVPNLNIPVVGSSQVNEKIDCSSVHWGSRIGLIHRCQPEEIADSGPNEGDTDNRLTIPRLAMARGRVSLVPTDDPGPPLADVELVEGTDPLLRFYEVAQRLREQIRDKAIQALHRIPDKFRHGVQIVTVVESPLAGHVIPSEGQTVSEEVLRSLKGRPPPPRLIVTASYEHWLVQGNVEASEIYSTVGEYPVDDELDLERLVWIDDRVRDGRIVLAHPVNPFYYKD